MAQRNDTSGAIAGVTVPLFSLRSAQGWGVGEILDLPAFARWMAESAGLKLVQILPLGEISGTETSPYAALSAFGIDWLYLSMAALEDLPEHALREALGGDMGLSLLRKVQQSKTVDYPAIRLVKRRALQWAWQQFSREHLGHETDRAQSFDAFCMDERSWLEDYALFRAIKDAREGEPWWKWEAPLRDREPKALDAARNELQIHTGFYKYCQWIAHTQWAQTRESLHDSGLEVMGDLPFMVGRDSADVWSHQREFRLDKNVGVPGDQFDPEGQDWGLPPYKWDAMRANDFAWLRRRARYAGSLYDRFRVDHLVGFYRTYMRPLQSRDARGRLVEGTFDPVDARSQQAHGERVVAAMKTSALERGATLIAEDLGTVPEWVRPSLAKLDVPGYKVLIWEKDSRGEFKNPSEFAKRTVSALGTHDTDSCVTWWETRDPAERAAFARLALVRDRAESLTAKFDGAVHRALLDVILSAGSELCLLLVQDVLSLRDRINVPGTVGPHNWTWRLPAPPEDLRATATVAGSTARVREAVRRSHRGD
ncbi:MAG: 4-alpha-glucanotransferase [Deltaproteobacteria bacterium]|nr:4-alpha-glucanotransferase [Deltaproteobacteria bacterium]